MGFDIDDIPFSWVRNELKLPMARRRGDRGKTVERIQEWLTLRDTAVVIDGDFGPATEYAVLRFQENHGMAATGVVDDATYSELTSPLVTALTPPATPAATLRQQIAATARLHRDQRPREVGGANRGPWVRVYMEGHDGPGYLWCAGFACFVVRQASWMMGADLPFNSRFSCDALALDSVANNRFVSEAGAVSDLSAFALIAQGCIFVQRRSARDWNHAGIVLNASGSIIETIEGNTNEVGGREGYEVCRRIRSIRNKDFIRFSEG